jgi:hypothetical protein
MEHLVEAVVAIILLLPWIYVIWYIRKTLTETPEEQIEKLNGKLRSLRRDSDYYNSHGMGGLYDLTQVRIRIVLKEISEIEKRL